VLNALAAAIDGRESTANLDPRERAFVRECSAQLAGPTTAGICVVGAEMPDDLHRWAATFNARFGRGAVRFFPAARSDSDPPPGRAGGDDGVNRRGG